MSGAGGGGGCGGTFDGDGGGGISTDEPFVKLSVVLSLNLKAFESRNMKTCSLICPIRG